jgi:xanthine/uracil permease
MFHIVKDKDGNERVMSDKEYSEYRSLNAAGNLLQLVVSGAFQRGGFVFAANILVLICNGLLYLVACAGGYFPPHVTGMVMLVIGSGLLLFILVFMIWSRWWGLIANVAVFSGMLYLMVVYGRTY